MTIMEAIEQADKEKPNTIDTATKERWISTLEGQIRRGLKIDHDAEASVLSVREPHDVMYIKYLIMRICLENGELDNYNKAAAVFHRLWMEFAAATLSQRAN